MLTRFPSISQPEMSRHPNNLVQYGLWPVLDALKIPVCGLHSFRHTRASLLWHTGGMPKVVREQLRHADPRVTLGTYSHVIREDRRNAVERAAALLRLTADASCTQLRPNQEGKRSGFNTERAFVSICPVRQPSPRDRYERARYQ